METFKKMLDEVEERAHRDLASSIAFRDLLEAIVSYVNDMDNRINKPFRVIDIVIHMLLLLNLMTTMAVYMMVR